MVINTKLIQKLINGHQKFIQDAGTAERYYFNHNSIKATGAANLYRNEAVAELNPLRLADNRISHDWHTLLVTQKIGYCLSYPPLFDLGNKTDNQRVSDVLGDEITARMTAIGIDASNTGVGWLHYWKDASGKFNYYNIDPKQVIPVFSGDLTGGLVGVLRCYTMLNPETGDSDQISEYWDDTKVTYYKRNTYGNYAYFEFPQVGKEMAHGMGAVPFIPFWNNATHTADLPLYKDLIDAYDKVYSGFNNDIDDVQEVIFVIKNYGGEADSKAEFVADLKKSKTITVEGDGGVETIRAEIPHEARNTFLDRTRKQIFLSGMGVDPDPQNFGNSSGVALKFLYSLLELKAGMMEAQFRNGFAELVKAVCRCEGMAEPKKIIQTWTRNAIQNDLETAQIAQQSTGIISEQSIIKNHPWVEDVEEEQKQLKNERDELQQQYPQLNRRADLNDGDGDEE